MPPTTPAQDPRLHAALQARLSRLSYTALSFCVERVLTDIGFTGVHPLGRTHFRGRTAFGGADLHAQVASTLGPAATLIQIKRYTRPVSRRFVDELRGVMLRHGIPNGLLVTTSTFSRPARAAANGFRGRPIRLIDGSELARHMLDHRIGIRQQENLVTREVEWVVDDEAFGFLRRYALERYLRGRKEAHAGRR
jgi:restriction endonuclease Mrr